MADPLAEVVEGEHEHLAAGRTTGNLTARLRRLDLPVLVVHGQDDPLIRPEPAATSPPLSRVRA